jgi:hypothetical protein
LPASSLNNFEMLLYYIKTKQQQQQQQPETIKLKANKYINIK